MTGRSSRVAPVPEVVPGRVADPEDPRPAARAGTSPLACTHERAAHAERPRDTPQAPPRAKRRPPHEGADRLDVWLVSHGHAATRAEAQAAIMAGLVTVNGGRADKAGRRVARDAVVAVRGPARPYASRGGVKLAHALAAFGIDPRGKTAIDLGASTGGFTDCLLRAGAARVYAVDVGHGQLAWRLRADPRVTVLDGVNARHLTPERLGARGDLVTADLAFISLRLVWTAIAAVLAPGGEVVVLIKPQFEAGRGQVGRGGVVRDPAVHEQVLRDVLRDAAAHGLHAAGVVPSPVRGPAGNVEYLARLRPGAPPAEPVDLGAAVAAARVRFEPGTRHTGAAGGAAPARRGRRRDPA